MTDRREEAQVLVTASLVSDLITEVRSLVRGIDGLASHLQAEVKAAKDAAEATEAIARATARSRRRDLIMTSALVAVVLMVLAVGLINWSNGREVRAVSHQSNLLNQQIVECTTPAPKGEHHPCFEAGQARTGAVVATVADATADEVVRRLSTTTTR